MKNIDNQGRLKKKIVKKVLKIFKFIYGYGGKQHLVLLFLPVFPLTERDIVCVCVCVCVCLCG